VPTREDSLSILQDEADAANRRASHEGVEEEREAPRAAPRLNLDLREMDLLFSEEDYS
jgi:hypothetical protein